MFIEGSDLVQRFISNFDFVWRFINDSDLVRMFIGDVFGFHMFNGVSDLVQTLSAILISSEGLPVTLTFFVGLSATFLLPNFIGDSDLV